MARDQYLRSPTAMMSVLIVSLAKSRLGQRSPSTLMLATANSQCRAFAVEHVLVLQGTCDFSARSWFKVGDTHNGAVNALGSDVVRSGVNSSKSEDSILQLLLLSTDTLI